jgi:hypothetical protein
MSAAPPAPSPVADQAYVDNAIASITTNGGWVDVNTLYLTISAYLVFFMHCGFAMVRILFQNGVHYNVRVFVLVARSAQAHNLHFCAPVLFHM